MDLFNYNKLKQGLLNIEPMEGIVGTALIRRNGLIISSHLPRDIDERKFGAMVATMFVCLDTAKSTLKSKKINNLNVEYEDYQVVAIADQKILIVALLEAMSVNIGLVFIELEELLNQITK